MATNKSRSSKEAAAEGATSKWLGWMKAIGLFVIGGIAGFATNYWIDYRSDYRSSLEARLDKFVTLSTSVSDSLAVLFQVAYGERVKEPSDVEALRKSLYDSVTEAQTLAGKLDNSSDLVRKYETAVVELQAASELLTGPLDAKPLIEASSNFLVAERELKDRAAQSYKSVL